jgi:hypothetical protein
LYCDWKQGVKQHTNFKMLIIVPHYLWVCSREKLKLDFLMWFCRLCRTSRLKSKSNNCWWVLSSLSLQASYNLQSCMTWRKKSTSLQLAQVLEKKNCLHLDHFSFWVSTKIIWKKIKIEPLAVVVICVLEFWRQLHMHEQDEKLRLQSYKQDNTCCKPK